MFGFDELLLKVSLLNSFSGWIFLCLQMYICMWVHRAAVRVGSWEGGWNTGVGRSSPIQPNSMIPIEIPWPMMQAIKIDPKVPYFIKYNAHTSIVHTWMSQWFLAKKIFLFFKNNFTSINHCKFTYHKSHLKLFLSYLPWIVCR